MIKRQWTMKKTNINHLNQTLNKLHKAGVHSTAELIDQRGFWSKLHKSKPKAPSNDHRIGRRWH